MANSIFKPRDHDWHPIADFPNYRSTHFRHPKQKLLKLVPTLTELTGPAFGHDDIAPLDNNLISNYSASGIEALGSRIKVFGKLLDENNKRVPNQLIEIWQANAGGRYRHVNDGYLAPLDDNFGGCGRCLTDEDGNYEFLTILPGAYPWPNGPNSWRPAHIHFSVFGQAFAQRLITQMYFEGDPLIDICPIVQAIPDKKAVSQLVARLDMNAAVSMDMLAYQFDIVLRGENETYFENK